MSSSRQVRRRLVRLREGIPRFTNSFRNAHEAATTSFDKETGQVYSESTSRILSSRDRPRYTRTSIKYGHRRGTASAHGSRSLQDVALEHVLRNIEDIATGLFQDLPLILVHKIWERVKERCSISFQTWLLFATYLHGEIDTVEDFLFYVEDFQDCRFSLDIYTKPLISDSFEYITSLCIVVPIPVADLLKLSRFRNLGILEILNQATQGSAVSSGVSDRLLRGWHHAATTEMAFPILRILKLCNHEDLTQRSLNYINGFPALQFYDVRGCNFDATTKLISKALGWKSTKGKLLLDVVQAKCQKLHEKLRSERGQILCDSTRVHESFNNEPIRHVPRDNVEEYLACRPKIATQKYPEGHIGARMETHTTCPRPSSLISTPESSFKKGMLPWQENLYRMYAGVGEYTNDADLIGTVKNVENVLAQGRELLVPLPMVFVNLGRVISSPTSGKGDPLVFFKSSAISGNERSIFEEYSQALQSSQDVTSSQASVTADSSRGKLPNVQKQKKRKLEDVLGAFG